jgi:adenylate cyclase class 2
MDEEFEAKFYPVEKESIRKRLKEIDAHLAAPERKLRRVIFDSRCNPQIKCDVIRVRDEGGSFRISMKIHPRQGKMRDQKEVEIEVNDFDKAVRILEATGLTANRYQETLRETWKYDGAEIDIDTWPGLKPFIEIEAESEDQVKKIAAKLNLDWKKRIIASIVDVFMMVYGLSAEEVLRKISNLTFENNSFSGLKPKV